MLGKLGRASTQSGGSRRRRRAQRGRSTAAKVIFVDPPTQVGRESDVEQSLSEVGGMSRAWKRRKHLGSCPPCIQARRGRQRHQIVQCVIAGTEHSDGAGRIEIGSCVGLHGRQRACDLRTGRDRRRLGVHDRQRRRGRSPQRRIHGADAPGKYPFPSKLANLLPAVCGPLIWVPALAPGPIASGCRCDVRSLEDEASASQSGMILVW